MPDIVEEKLNFFTFGAFANNAVVLKAIINEPHFDSGLDSVYIDYVDENGVATQEKMSLYNRTHIYDAFGRSGILQRYQDKRC